MKNANQEYIFENVILLESNFKRVSEVNYTSPEYDNNIEIGINQSIEENQVLVELTVNIKTGVGEEIDVEMSVKMLGHFTKNPEINQIPVEKFAQVNAPAIIFPFVREHIASVSSKAGIPTILLPPINFVKMAEEEDKNLAEKEVSQ
jgi:preprotein translocase subunit SecB